MSDWDTDPWAIPGDDFTGVDHDDPMTNYDEPQVGFSYSKERPVSDGNDQISITLKGGTGFDAPWIVVKGTSPEEALEILNKVRELGLMDTTAKAAAMFQGHVGGGSGGSGVRQGQGGNRAGGQNAKPATPPGVAAKSCSHGEMVYRTGNGAKGPWQAFFCPTPKGTPNQCAAVFL